MCGCQGTSFKAVVDDNRRWVDSVFPVTQLLFGQQSEGYDDQAAAGISCYRRVEAEEQPVCNGDEKYAQSEWLSVRERW